VYLLAYEHSSDIDIMQLLRKHIFYLSKLCYIAAAPSSRIHWQRATCTCIMTAWSRWLVTNCISQYSIEFTHWFSLLNCLTSDLDSSHGYGSWPQITCDCKEGSHHSMVKEVNPKPKKKHYFWLNRQNKMPTTVNKRSQACGMARQPEAWEAACNEWE